MSRKSNAERQKAYRDRKRNGRNAGEPQISGSDAGRDVTLPNGDQLIYLCRGVDGPLYARVVNHAGAATAEGAGDA